MAARTKDLKITAKIVLKIEPGAVRHTLAVVHSPITLNQVKLEKLRRATKTAAVAMLLEYLRPNNAGPT